MWVKVRVAGDDGARVYKPGADVRHDSEWLRRMVANGLGECLDGEARQLAGNAELMRRYKLDPLIAVARSIGMRDNDIPALALADKGET